MSLPIVREQNSTQIRMAIENYTKQIERLTLVPIRCLPNSGDCRDASVFLVK